MKIGMTISEGDLSRLFSGLSDGALVRTNDADGQMSRLWGGHIQSERHKEQMHGISLWVIWPFSLELGIKQVRKMILCDGAVEESVPERFRDPSWLVRVQL